jgi:PAS domain S-box-containing protein
MIASTGDLIRQRDQWLEGLPAGQFRLLFEHLPGTLFFAKDLEGRIMFGNPGFVARCGFRTEEELVGRKDEEMFSPRLAGKYRADDQKVMRSGDPLLGEIELFPNQEGKPEWSVTDKLPLYDRQGKVCGVCGTVRSYEGARAALEPYLELAPVADHIKEHFRERLDVPGLARLAGMSVRQLERKFRKTFKTTPRAYMVKMRVLEACRLLESTGDPVTEIALEVGFYDHSDFSRQFRKGMGMSPTAYRRDKLRTG